jgi:hypothetical protein
MIQAFPHDSWHPMEQSESPLAANCAVEPFRSVPVMNITTMVDGCFTADFRGSGRQVSSL